MLARMQRWMVVALLALAAGCLAIGICGERPLWGAIAMLVVLASHAIVLAAEFACLLGIESAAGSPGRAGPVQLLRAWLVECVTAVQVFYWRQPFRAAAEPDHLSGRFDRVRGVVLVHGYVCNRALWNPWMRALRARGTPFIAVNLEPVFGTIDAYAAPIESAVDRLERLTGAAVVVVGHSMGGLAIRAWLKQQRGDERVHRVITIGTPHGGTWLARFGRTTNSRQMRQGSRWLAELAAAEPAARARLFTCFYGHCDNIVFPTATATLPGATNLHLPGTAHVRMAFDARVFEEVCRWLEIIGAAPPHVAAGDSAAAPRIDA